MAHNNATKVSLFWLATTKCFKRTIKQESHPLNTTINNTKGYDTIEWSKLTT